MANSAEPTLVGFDAKITGAINACLQRSMTLPFVAVLVSPNGGVFCLRHEANEGGDGLEAVPLAEHGDPAGFASPINMLIVDLTGGAIRMAITAAGLTTYHYREHPELRLRPLRARGVARGFAGWKAFGVFLWWSMGG